jgi:ABC-type Fe3+/spermidine/putrescine transport system ATPase subunit
MRKKHDVALRCRLHTIDSGEVRIGGTTVADGTIHVRPEHRQINMVFQSYAIWPHMSVSENVGYGLRMQGMDRYKARARVGLMLELVGLSGFADRPATGLSGGQQQRVALARALATQPRILLLDEPLSNLDSVLRHRMRGEIMRLQRETGTTTLYVTHDCVRHSPCPTRS